MDPSTGGNDEDKCRRGSIEEFGKSSGCSCSAGWLWIIHWCISANFGQSLDPETVEALACREGVALATDLNLSKVQLACDSANVVRSIKSIALGSYGHAVREIQASSSCFESSVFVHEGRESNGDAHSLARSSVLFELHRQVWFFKPPEGINTRVTMNQ